MWHLLTGRIRTPPVGTGDGEVLRGIDKELKKWVEWFWFGIIIMVRAMLEMFEVAKGVAPKRELVNKLQQKKEEAEESPSCKICSQFARVAQLASITLMALVPKGLVHGLCFCTTRNMIKVKWRFAPSCRGVVSLRDSAASLLVLIL